MDQVLWQFPLATLPRYLFISLAVMVIWGYRIRKFWFRTLILCIIGSLVAAFAHQLHNETLRISIEALSVFILLRLILMPTWGEAFRIWIYYVFFAIIYYIATAVFAINFLSVSVSQLVLTPKYWPASTLPGALCSILAAFLLRPLQSRLTIMIRDAGKNRRELISLGAAMAIQLIILLGMLTQMVTNYSTSKNNLETTTLIMSAFVIIGTSIIAVVQAIRMSRRSTMIATQNAITDNITELLNSVRGERHDFANHLQIMYGLAQTERYEELADYLSQLVKQTNRYNEILKLGNPIIAALINAKLVQANARGIVVDIHVNSSFQGYEETAMDIARILGNLMDNAMDAADSQSDDAWMRVDVGERDESLIIKVANPCDTRSLKGKDLFQAGYTTKNGNHSGLGLYVCHQLAQNMGGSLEYQLKNGIICFILSVPKK